jgi:hypothetical protein
MSGKIREPINMIAANDKKYTTRKMIAEIIYSEYFIIHLFFVCIEYTIGYLACIGLIICHSIPVFCLVHRVFLAAIVLRGPRAIYGGLRRCYVFVFMRARMCAATCDCEEITV